MMKAVRRILPDKRLSAPEKQKPSTICGTIRAEGKALDGYRAELLDDSDPWRLKVKVLNGPWARMLVSVGVLEFERD